MKMQPTEFGNLQFSITRIHETNLGNMEAGDLSFEIELRLRHTSQKLFIGVLNSQILDCHSDAPHLGIGVSIDPATGEIVDVVNGQGIIGYLDEVALELNEPIFLCLEFEKLHKIFIPKLTVGEEKILHPALHLDDEGDLSLVVGSTEFSRSAIFENPHCMITRRSTEPA